MTLGEFEAPRRPLRPTIRPPRTRRTRLIAAVVALAVGFLIGVQVAREGEEGIRLAAETPADLARILADLNAEADQLAQQVAALHLQLFQYRTAASSDDVAVEDAKKALADLQVLAGIVPVEGPGVRVTVIDPNRRVGWELLLDLVQELRDAGAEAIAIGGFRVVASTWFGPAERGVRIDGHRLIPSYEVVVIGSSGAIREALGIPGGPVALLEGHPGVEVDIRSEDEVALPAVDRDIRFDVATPSS